MPTNSGQTAHVVQAHATATHSSPGVVATSIRVACSLVDRHTGHVYGTARGHGPAGVAAGLAIAPEHADLRACIEAHATFSDGSTASYENC